MKLIVFILLCLQVGPLWAINLDEVTLQEISSTGRSIAVDRGHLEDYNEGLYAKFFVKKGPKEFPKIFLVAEGELVKSFPGKSFWFFRQTYLPEQLKNQAKLLVMTVDGINAGRKLTIHKKHRVYSDKMYKKLDDFLEDNEENVPKRLHQEANQHVASKDIYEEEIKSLYDIEIESYESFKKSSNNKYSDIYNDSRDQNYFHGNLALELGDIRKAEDKKLLDDMANHYVTNTNSMKYGIKAYYREQEKLVEMKEFTKKTSSISTYDQIKENDKEKAQVQPRAKAKMARDGEMWSADMNDETLRRYFIQTGLEKEERRRSLALNELDGNEVLISYSGSMINHTSDIDPNYRGLGYNLTLGYDLHLSRTAAGLKNWSMQFFLERGVVDYDLGSLNARSEEGSYGGYLNYYFINNPLTLNAFIYLFGVGIKAGSAAVSAPDLNKEYSYQLLTLPSFQLMTKYRFRSGDLNEDTAKIGMSFNLGLNLDVKNLSTIDTIDDDINSKFTINDIKYLVGMSFYF